MHAQDNPQSGVKRLLDAINRMKADVIVKPLLKVMDGAHQLFPHHRILRPEGSTLGLYRSFVVDPVRAVSRFGPAQIIRVRPRGKAAPFSMRNIGQDCDHHTPFICTPVLPVILALASTLAGAAEPASPADAALAAKAEAVAGRQPGQSFDARAFTASNQVP